MKKGDGRYRPIRRWLSVTLLIPRGFEEAVTNFVMEQGATGIEEIDEDLECERIKTYFPQNGRERKVLFVLRRYLKSLQEIHPELSHCQIKATSIAEQNWGENWKKFFKPVQVTSRLVVKPPWAPTRLKKGKIYIDISPGMAFGTGAHATTKLCIQALEKVLQRKGLSVLDVGTGSGILSIVAAKLGAEEVCGIDIDEMAVGVARENVSQNNVSDIVKIRKGGIGDIRKRFDVVVANIDFKGLMKMRKPLICHLEDQGFLILSGILKEDEDRICRSYLEINLFQRTKVTQEEDWVCITLNKK
jgi:ribosomal protein L11 methyltransferase